MKKYNLSEIMKNAWAIRRTENIDMSSALKKAWAAAKRGTVESAINGEIRTIETIYRRAKGWQSAYYKNEVLEAIDDGAGNITLKYASGDFEDVNTRTSNVTYQLRAGALDGELFGLDLSRVQSISGKTYSVKNAVKAAGFRWNPDSKNWVRR